MQNKKKNKKKRRKKKATWTTVLTGLNGKDFGLKNFRCRRQRKNDEEEHEVRRLTFRDQPQNRKWSATPTLSSHPFYS